MSGNPERVSVKVKFLRKCGCDNLEEWLSNPSHKLVTRNGRVFIGTKENKKIFHYPKSRWCNPFTVKDYGLEDCMAKFEEYLKEMLKDEKVRKEFQKDFEGVTEVGCFCDPTSKCHGDVILKYLHLFEIE